MTVEPTTGNQTAGTNVEALIERYHDLAVHTQNPVWLWRAIELVLLPRNGEAAPFSAPVSIPGWVASYLLDAASRMTSLADGVDFRKEPEAMDFAPFLEDGEELDVQEVLQSPEFKAIVQSTSISPKDAAAAVSHALGIVQGSRNLFSEALADQSRMQEARFYDAAVAAGLPAKRALDSIRKGTDARATTDPQLYARMKQARKLF